MKMFIDEMHSPIRKRPATEVLDPNRKEHFCNTDKNGNCSRCGACCTCLLPISDGELKQIQNYISRNGIKPNHHGDPNDKDCLDLVCPC